MIRKTINICWNQWIVSVCACMLGWPLMASTSAEDSLEAWWSMDEIVDEGGVRKVKDRSGNGRDLVCGDDLAISKEETRTGLYFPGTDKAWSTFTTPNGMQNRAISFWMYHRPEVGAHYYNSRGGTMPTLFESLNGWKVMLSCNLSTGQNALTLNSVYAPNVVVAEAGELMCPGDLVKTGVWRHHVMMLELQDLGNDQWNVRSIYCVNGRFVYASDWHQRANFQNHFGSRTAWFGNQSHSPLGDSASTANRPVHAVFDEVRLYSRILTAEEVFDEYERSRNASRACLAHWSMNNGSASSVTDDSGNGHALALGADAELVSAAVAAAPGGNGSLLLKPVDSDDGKGSAIAYSAGCRVTREHTISFWIKQLKGGNRNPNFWRPNAGGTGFYLFGAKDGGYISLHDDWSTLPTIRDGRNPQSVADEWMHVASKAYYELDPATSNLNFKVATYVNGRRAMLGDANTYGVTENLDLSQVGLFLSENMSPNFCVGCSQVSAGNENRAFNGYISDFRILDYPVSDSEAADLYCDSLVVKETFVTSRDTVGLRLAGDVAERGTWRAVSVPAGGEAAASQGSAEGVTSFSLPVCGDYVFASVEHPWCVRRVRRIPAVADNQPPVVTVTASSATVDGAAAVTVSASVSDDGKLGICRGCWTKVSGPGGVWFGDVTVLSTTARFGAVGDYVLRYVADDGQDTGSADVTVTLTQGETESIDLSNGLIASWDLNVDSYESVSKANPLTFSGRAKMTSEGVLGSAMRTTSVELDLNAERTGVSVHPGYVSTGYNSCLLEETENVDGANRIKEPYRTVSLWMYHDPSVPGADNVKYAVLVGQQYSFQLTYNPLDGADTFRIYTQGNGGTACSLDFAKPSFSTRGKWVHVCFVMNRRDGSALDNAVWVNGVKLERTVQSGLANVPRIGSGTLCINGLGCTLNWSDRNHMNNYLYKSGTSQADAEWYSRSFPGKVDEVKVWNRKLTDAEIRRISISPDVDVKTSIPFDLSTPRRKTTSRMEFFLGVSMYIDAKASGVGPFTYKWEVVSGESGNISFSDPTMLSPRICAIHEGVYGLQLTVCSPDGCVKSVPIRVEIRQTGLKIFLH